MSTLVPHRTTAPSTTDRRHDPRRETRWPRRGAAHPLATRIVGLALVALVLTACGGGSGVPTPSGGDLAVTPADVTLGVGATRALDATLDGAPTTAIGWATANAAVASVDATGRVTGVGEGTTTVTATSTADATLQGTASVTVVPCTAPTVVDANVTVLTTWSAQGNGCTDVVVEEAIDVYDALTVDAGTVVRFAEDAGLRIGSGGTLVVAGTSSAPVSFAGTEASPGWWRGIEYWRSEDLGNRIAHAEIAHAGRIDPATGLGYALKLGGPDNSGTAFVDVTDTIVRDGAGYGLYVSRDSRLPTFAGNTVTGHALGAGWVSAKSADQLNGTTDFRGNGDDVVIVEAGETHLSGTHDVTEDATWPRLAHGVPYRLDGLLDVMATLTIEPGVTIEVAEDGGIRAEDGGRIVADGTSTAPIVFTGSQATRGHWRGVLLRRPGAGQASVFDHVTIEYGGRDVGGGEAYGANLAIGSFASQVDNALGTTVTNTTLRESAGYGLYVSSRSTFAQDGFADNTLTANADGAARVSARGARWLDDGTTYAGNDLDEVRVHATEFDDLIDLNSIWPALGAGVRYSVEGLVTLEAVLTLAPGATLAFRQNAGVWAYDENAGLVADGTAAAPILLTGEIETGGSWDGVYLRRARMSGNVLDHVTIEYGGGREINVSNALGNLVVGQIPSNTAQMTITNSTFRHAGVVGTGVGYGLWVAADSVVNADVCTANAFSANEQGCLREN